MQSSIFTELYEDNFKFKTLSTKLDIIIFVLSLTLVLFSNLLSPKEIEIRINRSIQVEGTFGQLKQNMQHVRIRRIEIDKVTCEIMFMCLGRNIRKFFALLDNDKIKSNYWEKPNNLKKEKFPFVKPKKKKD